MRHRPSRKQANGLAHRLNATQVAKRMLDKYDLDPRLIRVSGRGEFHPMASNESAEGRAQNRRVEIHISIPPPVVNLSPQ